MRYIGHVILLTMGLAGFLRCQDDFYFSVSPQSESVAAGSSLRLRCAVSSSEHIVYAWTLNGRLLDNSTRRFQDGSDLVFRRVDRLLDSGQFLCTATNISTGFSVASLPAVLSIQWISNTTQVVAHNDSSALPASGIVHIPSGSDVTLRCKSDGFPELHYDWFKNGAKLTKFKSKRLHVSKASAADGGTYCCAARNAAGATRIHPALSLQVTEENQPRLEGVSADLTLVQGTAAALSCSFQPPVAVQWLFSNNTVITNTSKFTTSANGERLMIDNVTVREVGFYKCRTPGSAPLEFGTSLTIAYINNLTSSSLEPSADEKGQLFRAEFSSLEVDCVAPDGLPAPVVWWEGPEGTTMTSPASVTSLLSIGRLSVKDSGSYTCWAENSAGRRSVKLHLVVTTVPVLQQHPTSLSVNEGEEAVLGCSFLGTAYPGSRISWLRDGRRLFETLSTQGARNSTLRIKAGLSDAGNYACLIETIGLPVVRSQSATVIVREILKFSPPPMDRKLELGSSARVQCRAQGQPAPVVRWVKEGQPFFQWPSHVDDVNGTLFFRGVQAADRGTYTCVATNSQGIINATIEISLLPRFTMVPENPTFVRDGGDVYLHCRAEGEPQPAIQWDKDSVLNGFDAERFTVFPNGTLLITSARLEDEGRYGCIAGNAAGFKREEIRLLIQGFDGNDDSGFLTKTVGITLGAAAAYILLAAALLLWCRLRRRRKRKKAAAAAANATSAVEAALLPKGDLNDVRSSKQSSSSRRSNTNSTGSSSSHGGSSPVPFDKWNTPRVYIDVGDFVGKGDFGEVRKGWIKVPNSSTNRVLLRCLSTKDDDLLVEFRRQADMFQRAVSPYLASVVGFSRDFEPQMLLVDYADQQILKTFLRNPSSANLSQQLLLQLCAQIARGMAALAAARFVHKDLGTRNVLVSFSGANQVSVKITSLCLNKEPFGSDYCRVKNQLLPLRWLPQEAVLEDEYSTKSDVWMFACTAWEVLQQAQQPFASLSDESVLRGLSSKSLQWDAPPSCSLPLKALLDRCWSHDPQLRPSFDAIGEFFNSESN